MKKFRWLAAVSAGLVAQSMMLSPVHAFSYGGGTTTSYNEGTVAVTISSNINVAWADTDFISASTGTISITSGFVAGDLLTYEAPNCLTNSSFNASTGVMTITGPAGCDSPVPSYWQQAFRAIKFTTTADTPNTTRSIRFTTSNQVSGSHTVTLTVIAGAPDQPGRPLVEVGNQSAVITVTPATTGLTARSHIVTATPGGRTCEVTSSLGSCTISGLTNGESYTFTSTSRRLTGESIVSPASLAVTPRAPELTVQKPNESAPVVSVSPQISVSTTTIPPTTTAAPTSSNRVLKVGKSLTAKSMAQVVSLTVSRTSVIKLSVTPSTKSKCRIVGARVQGIRSGTCKIRVSVSTRGTTVIRTATVRISR